MTFEIVGTIASKVGFASHQNAVPLVRELKLHAAGDDAIEHCELRLSADPPFVQQKTWRLDRLAPGDELVIADRDVQLNATLLSGLTESVAGSITLTLHSQDGEELARKDASVELLAHNQWGGSSAMAELLPAFSMPNDPAVDRVLKSASDALRRAGKPSELDGYRSKERARVWLVASAIWSAACGLRLSYALPPASFERQGQKIRTPGAILDGRVATCLDTALLFSAALEQAGLHPLVILTKGHAFTGVWLQPLEFASILTDEAAALRRRIDLDDLLVFETTLATNDPPASFMAAIDAARRQLAEPLDGSFEMAVDIHRARMQRIWPLGVAVGPKDKVDTGQTTAEGLQDAPLLPAFDVEVEAEADTPGDRIRQWQRKLLNLTTSNRLLHVPESAKVLRLHCPEPGKLEDLLASGHKLKIGAMPDLEVGGRDEATYERQTQTSLRDEVARQMLERNEVLSTLAKDKLDAQLVELYRKARTDLEEGGTNTLYLALGFLKWRKSAAEDKVYRAPLILLPVKLERRSALSGVVMVQHEDEPRFNLTLLELLRQDFDLATPGLEGELPKDEHGIDLDGIWRIVRSAVREMPGFEVIPDLVVGTFSFAKYLMWKDLVDRADHLKQSPLVKHIIERGGDEFGDREKFPRPESLDDELTPADLFTPLPADSSQLAAIVASARGQSFVLDGPPGCGKSQTIANMIAHNLALGRRVLFVAEKRAALEVVQRRLADKGLGPFCLELHSAKATKTAVLRQLDQAWSTRDAMTAEEWEEEALEARALRDSLNALVRLLHRRQANGWTIQQAIGLVVREGPECALRFDFGPDVDHHAEDIAALRDVARRLGLARAEVSDIPADMNDVAASEWSNAWQDEVIAAASAIPALLDELEQAAQGLRTACGLPLPGEDAFALGRRLAFVRTLLQSFSRDDRLAFSPVMADQVVAAREGLQHLERYRAEEAALSVRYVEKAAARIPVDALRAAWSKACGQVWPLSMFAKGRVARDLAREGGAAGKVRPDADLPRLAVMRDLLATMSGLAPRASGVTGWNGLETNAVDVEAAIGRAERLRAAIAAEAGGPDELAALKRSAAALVVESNELLDPEGPIARAASRLARALEAYEAGASRYHRLAQSSAENGFAALRAQALAIVNNSRRLRDWANWRRVRGEAVALSLSPLVEALETGLTAPEDASRALELGYAFWFAARRMDEEPLLKTFAGNEQMDRIQRFRAVDERLSELSSRFIRAKICGLIPDKSEASRKDGYGVLRHQLQLQRQHKPIRQLAAEMGDAFTRLAPCMLMSPLSIAQYLPADQALFDLVIFDEASQITPWDAIGAMARGKQVVIAGDPRQMPPSNDFQRSADGGSDGDGTEADLSSILEECLAAGVPQHSLDWHYRSRHESLIAFSNHRYYDSRLVTFPAPQRRPTAVSWVRVQGVWARGAERTNAIEARAIVEEAVRRLRDPKFVDGQGQPLSLGVITMNIEQMRLVEDLLDRARRAYPEIEPHFRDDRLEPVVVRNLETAQGDERDVILIGVGFGPTDPHGQTMSMGFGKLNTDGGWRRLNVAVTRARQEMVLFTSFDAGMIDLTRTSQQAVADLKQFIEYAERGPKAIAQANRGSLGDVESPFEQAVANALRDRGWTVVPQVGVSKFRIDLGVVHPDRPGDYLAGVECDGATYHSAATARDRDKVRASILENLGWKLLRVWSTEWWTDRERAADKTHQALEALLEADRVTRAQAESAGAAAIDELPAVTPEDNGPPPESSLNLEFEAPQDLATYASPAAVAGSPAPVLPEEAPSPGATSDGLYRITDFKGLAHQIDPANFYEPQYDETLRQLIEHVVASEGPIAQINLVQRLARAHAFARAGGVIRERVMTLVRARHHVDADGDAEPFIWASEDAFLEGVRARFPATDEDIRQVEDIALVELRAAGSTDPVEIARRFGVRRLSATARARIERALAT
ncbi:DUF3320 domain-containing protein [Caulobacter sp. KR2-114]|uniref:DUF3320 domain-containing protein n=1 Tax=Caulobacter sp. KR2-114 TaxID=3400912 RepID=UPI003BFD928C